MMMPCPAVARIASNDATTISVGKKPNFEKSDVDDCVDINTSLNVEELEERKSENSTKC
jgi:hypothetical protein